MIYFEWLVPCLLLNCKRRSFFAKVTLSNSCLVAVFRVLHFTRYETTILRCGGLYCYCLVYKIFLHICWKFDENTCTVTQIMTNNVRFLFFLHSVYINFVSDPTSHPLRPFLVPYFSKLWTLWSPHCRRHPAELSRQCLSKQVWLYSGHFGPKARATYLTKNEAKHYCQKCVFKAYAKSNLEVSYDNI